MAVSKVAQLDKENTFENETTFADNVTFNNSFTVRSSNVIQNLNAQMLDGLTKEQLVSLIKNSQRNVTISKENPVDGQGKPGDIWIKYNE